MVPSVGFANIKCLIGHIVFGSMRYFTNITSDHNIRIDIRMHQKLYWLTTWLSNKPVVYCNFATCSKTIRRTGRRVARLPTSTARGRHVDDRCIVTSCRHARSMARRLLVTVAIRDPHIVPTHVVRCSDSVPDNYLAQVPVRRRSFAVMCHPHSGGFTRIAKISIERSHPTTITLR